MFITKEGIVKGRGIDNGGTFTVKGSTKLPLKNRANFFVENEEDDIKVDLFGDISQEGHRIDMNEGYMVGKNGARYNMGGGALAYWYIVSENTEGS